MNKLNHTVKTIPNQNIVETDKTDVIVFYYLSSSDIQPNKEGGG